MLSHSAAISSICSLRRYFHAPPSLNLQTDAFFCRQKKRRMRFSLSPPALPFDLSPPPIDLDPLETVTSAENDGATYSYADEYEALDAVGNGAVVVDLSDYGRIRVKSVGKIVCSFFTIKQLQTLKVLVKARDVTQFLRHLQLEQLIFLMHGSWYIFFSDKVEIQDITQQTSMCALLGPKCSKIMEELNLGDLVGKAYGSHKHYSIGGMPLTVAVGSIISVDGFTFMMSPDAAGSIQKALIGQGAVSMSPGGWETLRILQGRPAPGKELTEEFNVLEAGLWRAVSLNKGCYKGQETIARLVTYDGIKQRLWGIRLSSQVEPGSIITVDGKKVGKLTSYTAGTKTSGNFGLGYVKRRAASEGDSVIVGDSVVGTLVEVPFLRDQPPPSKA